MVVEVRGDLDLATAPLLNQHLKPYTTTQNVTGQHRRRIVFLLSDVAFIDTSGLQALLGATDSHGLHTISVREPSPRVRRLLELVGMDAMIETLRQ